jgi:hypothetical protein
MTYRGHSGHRQLIVGCLKRRAFNKQRIISQVRSLTWHEHPFEVVNISANLGYDISRLFLHKSIHPLFGFPDVLDRKKALC